MDDTQYVDDHANLRLEVAEVEVLSSHREMSVRTLATDRRDDSSDAELQVAQSDCCFAFPFHSTILKKLHRRTFHANCLGPPSNG